MRRHFIPLLSAGVLILSVCAPLRAWTVPAHAEGQPAGHGQRAICGKPGARAVGCDAEIVTDAAGNALVGPNVMYGSLAPVQFHAAYNLPCSPGGPVQAVCAPPTTFGPQTIAIVDAFNDPTVEYDLGIYDAQWGLPDCTVANGCLTLLNENGGADLPTAVDGNWALETSLDVQTAHEICQTCRIVLVEATSNTWTDLATGVNMAAGLGVTAVSNSYGGSEWAGETSLDSSYNHPGVAVVASAGDAGAVSQYPASSPYVVSVGGTTLNLNGDGTYQSETAWVNTGSGCSSYEPANSWEMALPNWSGTGCGSRRGASDISADANPYTGAAVFDSTVYNGAMGWYEVGGTSLSAPIVAAAFALVGGVPAGTNAEKDLYSNFNSGDSRDIVSGFNGTCTTLMCNAAPGYDGPTGLGSPNGTAGFSGSGVTPPPGTSTPTSTLVPTASPSPTATSPPTPTVTPGQADFQLAASPSALSVPAGKNGSYTVTLNALGSYKSSVKLSVSGLPAGASASFSASAPVPSAAGATSTLQVRTGNNTPGGTYALTITGAGTDPGATTHSTQVTLLVPSVSLSPASTSLTVKRGTSGTNQVTVTGLGGYSSAVTLGTGNLPPGVSAAFSPNPVTPTGASTLTLTVSPSAGTGTKSVTVTGNGTGVVQQKVTFNLTITQ